MAITYRRYSVKQMVGNEGNGNVNLSVILRRIMNMAVKKTVTKAAQPANKGSKS